MQFRYENLSLARRSAARLLRMHNSGAIAFAPGALTATHARDITAFVLGYPTWAELRATRHQASSSPADERLVCPDELRARRTYQAYRLLGMWPHLQTAQAREFIEQWRPTSAAAFWTQPRPEARASACVDEACWESAPVEPRYALAFESVKIEVSEKAVHSYQPFSVDQLQAFFDAPVHSRGLLPAKGGREAAFWLPLLGLFEGMRLEEAGSLTCGALNERSGRYWIRLGRSKTMAGLREIPLHSELKRLNFIEYCATRSVSGRADEPLVPMLHMGSKENLTHMFSTWVNEYIDKHVVDDPAYVFHSFRNSFEDAATAAGVAEDVRRALMGHAQVAMTRRYGKKDGGNRRIFPDRALIEEIDMVRYDGLDLSHVTLDAGTHQLSQGAAARPDGCRPAVRSR